MKTLSMTVKEAKELLSELGKVFDIARLVDPARNRIIELDEENGRLRISDQICHAVWNRGQRCPNCVSSRALTSGGRAVKFEYLDGDPYIVVAQYVEVEDYPCVLETVIMADKEIYFSETPDAKAFLNQIRRYNQELGKDTLCSAKSREYYDEQICVLRIGAVVALQLEDYDELEKSDPGPARKELDQFASVVIANCRPDDILVRYDGGTFLLCCHNLTNEDNLKMLMRRLQSKLQKATEDGQTGSSWRIAISGCYGPGLAEDLVPEALNALKQSESNLDLMIAVAFIEPPPIPFPEGDEDAQN